MLCCDYKILAKILSKRIQTVIHKVISPEEFCVPGRSINTCNTLIRDIVYYCNEKRISGAILNLDWSKAFDRVDIEFVLKILDKLGFCSKIISLVKMLYRNIESCCIINGYISKSFCVERGVRQGCPLSMFLYAIFQEPLYLAIKKNSQIGCLPIPNNKIVKILGYADDSNIFVASDNDILQIYRIVSNFEVATECLLNKSKTKIFGLGPRSGRTTWPLSWLIGYTDSFKTLGIVISNDYEMAVDSSWTNILCKIKNTLSSFLSRRLTLHQKAIIVNSLVFSKAWYTSHIYPLPVKYAKLISKEVFFYIWGKKCEFIKRDTLTLPKLEGGIGIISPL